MSFLNFGTLLYQAMHSAVWRLLDALHSDKMFSPNCKCQSWCHKSVMSPPGICTSDISAVSASLFLTSIHTYVHQHICNAGEWESAHLEKRLFSQESAGDQHVLLLKLKARIVIYIEEHRVWCLPIRLPLASSSSNGGVCICTDKLCSVLQEREKATWILQPLCLVRWMFFGGARRLKRQWRGSCYLGDTRTHSNTHNFVLRFN
jgi:hypothetical protein